MPESGQLIGPYRLISQLGRGAMGEVWRARDERLDRYVALKILPADTAGDLERRARMLREARAAAAIRHANVVTLFDIVSHEGEDILVMELVEGRTLSNILHKDGAVTLERGLEWIETIADALVAAHAKGILHRDIKAANVMVTEGDAIKVLDFGLAKLMRDGEVQPAAVPVRPSAKKIALDETMASETGPNDVDLGATMPTDSPAMRPAQVKVALDETMASEPPVRPSKKIALDETMKSEPRQFELDSYRTHAGQLIGTPLYMAPEQIDGLAPDERSEVFSVGILAYEILSGKPPYKATTMDALFRQIQKDQAPMLDVPDDVDAIVRRAIAKDPAQRYASMKELRDAVAAVRAKLFAPPARRWPLYAAIALLVVGGAIGIWRWRAAQPEPAKPGDEYVKRALDEYDVFYNDKAMSSLRAALRVAPEHPRANAYVLLLGFASDSDRATAVAAGKRALASAKGTDKALLDAAITLAERGSRAAVPILAGATDRELRFWKAELDYRAGNYETAAAGYKQLLADDTKRLRGRIYDHYSSVLLYLDDTAEAKRIGTLYRDAFPGEADAVGVYATTLSAAGEHDAAVAAAEEALRLAEAEDSFAGLGKVLALKGDRKRAIELYARSLERAGASRRPVRRAALALLQWIEGDLAGAKTTVAPCLPKTRAADAASGNLGGPESTQRERGACLFVAGVLDPANADSIAAQLDALAAEATELRPAYGAPARLAKLVRARAKFFGGACITTPDTSPPPDDDSAYREPLDFFAAYHVPFYSTWAVCEHAAALAARGDKAAARAVLEPITKRSNRPWVEATLLGIK